MIWAMIGYVVFACAVVCLVGYLAHLRSARELRTTTAEAIAELRSTLTPNRREGLHTPHGWLSDTLVEEAPFEMVVPVGHRPYVLLTIKLHPENATQLHPTLWGALLLMKVDDLEEGLGGSGLKLDIAGSKETASAVTFKLIPRTGDGASQRLAKLRDRLMEWKRVVKERVRTDQDNDLNWRAECELANDLDEVAVQLAE